MIGLWLRYAPRDSHERRMQLVTLAVLLLILLPAISMTDDLMAAQNPAEIDSCLRRGHEYLNAHSVFPVLAAVPVPAFVHTPLRLLCLLAPGTPSEPAVYFNAKAPIQNRPPPVG